jgi:hypothetical protein
MAATTVFFSWQSDRPPKDCRNFIGKALEMTVRNISRDIAVDQPSRDIQLDKDTKDVAGSPPVFETIREKIERAAVFVPDLTFVGTRPNGEPTPNPNVLIEYGYAFKSVTYHRIVAVMNAAYGDPARHSLPFDLAGYRFPITYNVPEGADDSVRKTERDKLIKTLERAIKGVLESEAYLSSLPKPTAPPTAIYREPAFGRARFRRPDQPIGVYMNRFTKLTGQGEPEKITLADGPAMWLRVAPVQPIESMLKVADIEDRTLPLVNLPLFGGGAESSTVRNSDGAGWCLYSYNQPAVSTVFAFTDGEIWAIDTFSLRAVPQLVTLDERVWITSLRQCAKFLADIGIQGPYRWIAGFEGINDRSMPQQNHPFNRGHCMSDLIEVEGRLDTPDDVPAALEPFFEKVFDQCGLRRAR